MTNSPMNHLPVETSTSVELTDDQRAYESLFGLVPEWHAPQDTTTTPADVDDDELYNSLFGG